MDDNFCIFFFVLSTNGGVKGGSQTNDVPSRTWVEGESLAPCSHQTSCLIPPFSSPMEPDGLAQEGTLAGRDEPAM